MNELYELLVQKLNDMRKGKCETVGFTYEEVSQMWQFVCLMKRVKEIVDWSDKDA